MKWIFILGSVVLTLGLCTQSFGFGHRMNACGCDTACDTCGCEPSCGAAPACGCETSCGAAPACGCESNCCCPKMKYYKKVCHSRVKRCKTGCGCCKTKMCVTHVKYRRVLCPCKHCPDDLICAACKPCGYTTCTPICGCGCDAACGCEPVCGCEPACGCAGGGSAAPPTPQADTSAYLHR